MSIRYLKKTLLVILCLVFGLQLSSCATDSVTTYPTNDDNAYKGGLSVQQEKTQNIKIISEGNDTNILQVEADEPIVIQGDIEFLNNASTDVFDLKGFRKLLQAEERPSGIVLNFEGADLKEVISLILGKIMQQNYLIDPAVKGEVTLKTETPLNKDTVFYMLENILDIYGARIVKRTGHYRIFPKNKPGASMLGFGDIDNRIKLGYGYRIIPLKYVSSVEMVKILESVTNEDIIIRADDIRNLIILGGTSGNIRNMLNAIKMFDVDWMRGTNVGLIKINYSKVDDVLDDLKKMLTSNQVEFNTGGILTLDSIERLNTILVITKQRRYLRRVEEWVRKLDIQVQGVDSRLYVYHVKNLTAKELAATLEDLFSSAADEECIEEDNVTGPGSIPVLLSDSGAEKVEQDADSSQNSPVQKTSSDIKIIAAEDTNSLLISATPVQYAKIEHALSNLDKPPLQVLIEVTIMDVQLTGSFSYGMQWFLEHGDANSGGSAIIGDALNFARTFSYSSVRSGGDVRSILGLLAADGKVDVLSSPSVLVRNNRNASIRVGDQQPISKAVLNEDGSTIATSVEYRDTGILLEIQPSITSSGTINVDLTQEVIDVGDIDTATGQRTFLNRNLSTTVSVNNGETIILGGLIRTNQANSKSGVPWLRDIPILGFLFGQTVTSDVRTELLIMLTPRIIRNPDENNEVMEEYKSKFSHLSF